MRYLSTVYISNHRARVRHRSGTLIVDSPEGSKRIPLEGIDSLIILGGAQVTTQALDACTQIGIRVAALKKSGALRFVVNGKTGGNVHLRTALFRTAFDDESSLDIAKAIVAAKLQNSRHVVERWARDARDSDGCDGLAARAAQVKDRISRVNDAKTADHVRGIEGDGARIYFRALGMALRSSGLEFDGRSRRPPRDPVNAALGFCYGLLVTEFIGATESVGLDYQIGFLHRPRAGRPSLALDLTEELRSLTDRFVVSLVRRRQLTKDAFDVMPGGAVYLSADGRAKLLEEWERHKESELNHPLLGRPVARWALPSVQATILARHLRGDLPSYPPFLLS